MWSLDRTTLKTGHKTNSNKKFFNGDRRRTVTPHPCDHRANVRNVLPLRSDELLHAILVGTKLSWKIC